MKPTSLVTFETVREIMPDFLWRVTCRRCDELLVSEAEFEAHHHTACVDDKMAPAEKEERAIAANEPTLFKILQEMLYNCAQCGSQLKCREWAEHQVACVATCPACHLRLESQTDHDCISALRHKLASSIDMLLAQHFGQPLAAQILQGLQGHFLPLLGGEAKQESENCVLVGAHMLLHEPQANKFYAGGQREGQKHGKGVSIVFQGPNKGHQYAGEFKDGAYHGFGTYEWPNGERYTGEFTAGERHGAGLWFMRQGFYAGQFVRSQRSGFGVVVREQSAGHSHHMDAYCGQFDEDQSSGLGTYVQFDRQKGQSTEKLPKPTAQESYSGQWTRGCYHGLGLQISTDGSTYAGQFSFDQRQGQGILTQANSTKSEAVRYENETIAERRATFD